VARVPHYTAHLFTASKEDALANGLQLETLDKAQTVLVLLQKPENDRLALEAGGAVQEHGWRELEEDEKELACDKRRAQGLGRCQGGRVGPGDRDQAVW
jgi:hypothetical protein